MANWSIGLSPPESAVTSKRMCSTISGCGTSASDIFIGRSRMPSSEKGSEKSTEKILYPFATEMRHLTSALNVIASDMIRDRTLAKKLDDDPDYFRKNYAVTEEELTAMRDRNMIRLYE